MNNEPVTLEVGQKAPDFNAQITNGDEIKLSNICLLYTSDAADE